VLICNSFASGQVYGSTRKEFRNALLEKRNMPVGYFQVWRHSTEHQVRKHQKKVRPLHVRLFAATVNRKSIPITLAISSEAGYGDAMNFLWRQ
jgi:hypothetical protein